MGNRKGLIRVNVREREFHLELKRLCLGGFPCLLRGSLYWPETTVVSIINAFKSLGGKIIF